MTRNHHKFLLCWLGVCWAVCVACGQPAADSTSADPNATGRRSPAVETPAIDFEALRNVSLVVVTLDTTRADHLEPYAADSATAQELRETPYFADLARQGVLFERAWATAPVTLPTHASLFTGLDPPRHGVRNNGIHYLSPDVPLLAEILHGQSFRTAAFVSAAVLDHRYGLDRGFDLYDDDLSVGAPKGLRLNAERPATQTVAAARRWLDELETEDRFFLWVHLFDPHAPYSPPSPWNQRFQNHPYGGEIAAVDAALGTLLEHPRLASRRDHLLVVVADHGESLGAHGESTHAMLAYDATLRIPWLMRMPVGGDGLRVTPSVSQIDLLPTVLDLLLPDASAVPPEIDGLSLRPMLATGNDPRLEERFLYAETLVPFYTYGWAPLRALRQGEFKYIDAPTPELYDLAADAAETRNLLTVSADGATNARVESLRQALQNFETGIPTRQASLVVDAEMTAKLRSLGYLGSRAAPERTSRPDPKTVIALHEDLERAQHLFVRQDFEAAIDILQRVLRRDGDNLIALATLAKALAAVDPGDKALQLAQRAVQLDPDNPDLWVTSGLIELSGQRFDAALAAFDAALAIDPHWVDAIIEKARLLLRLQRIDEGVSLLEKLLDEDPRQGRALVALAEYVHLPAGRLQTAEEQLRGVVERQPDLVEARRVLGRVLEAGDQTTEALDVYRRGIERLPNDGSLQARLGVLLARMGQWEAAEAPLRRALEGGQGSSPTVHLALADVARRSGDWQTVEQASRRALELDAEKSSAWNLLAASLEEQGRFDEALQAYGRAIALDAAPWRAIFNRSTLLARLQRFSAAREGFEEVLRLQPEHGKSHFQLGALYAGALGDFEAARRHFEASLAVEKDPQAAARTRRLLAQLPPR